MTRLGTGLRQTQQPAQRLSQALQRAVGLLQMDNAELCGMLVEEAARNPHLAVMLPMPDAPLRRRRHLPGSLAGRGDFDAAAVAAPAAGLHAHVLGQVALLFARPAERRIAEAFACALDPSGWLGEEVAEVARSAGCSEAAAAQVLARLQTMEPAGLFARSLAECLGLQLAETGALDAQMRRLLEKLPALARGDTALLLRHCEVGPEELGRMVARLRSLDPKPGTQFETAADLRRAADVLVSRDAAGVWQVTLNDATMPDVHVLALAGTPAAASLATARWLERTLSRRKLMILQVARHVVAHQQAFLEAGPSHLRPLTCADVGAALGLHETTVGRVRGAVLVQTPRRTLPLRAFFARTRVAIGTSALAGDAVAELIGELIRAEPPGAPLTDAQVVEALAARGIRISRRTLTNWRNRAGHPRARTRAER